MDRDLLIKVAYEAFENFKRPDHFTDYTHCGECCEHDEVMRSKPLSEIGAEEFGSEGWSPIPFLTDEAYGYVLPRLIEHTLTNGENSCGDPFVFQYLLAINPSSDYRDFDQFTKEQVSVIRESLHYIKNNMMIVIENECCEDSLNAALEKWN